MCILVHDSSEGLKFSAFHYNYINLNFLKINGKNNLSKLHCCSSLSQICHVSGAKIAKRMSPNSKVYILNNCGHAISVEKPVKTAKLITEFVSSHSNIS